MPTWGLFSAKATPLKFLPLKYTNLSVGIHFGRIKAGNYSKLKNNDAIEYTYTMYLLHTLNHLLLWNFPLNHRGLRANKSTNPANPCSLNQPNPGPTTLHLHWGDESHEGEGTCNDYLPHGSPGAWVRFRLGCFTLISPCIYSSICEFYILVLQNVDCNKW